MAARRRKGDSSIKAVVIAVVLAIVVAGGAYVWIQRSKPERVAVLGDSITALTEDQLYRISHHYTLEVGAVPGATAERMEPAAQLLAAKHPSQVILNLGTNNALQRLSPTDAVAQVQHIIGLFPQARCIHLVTLSTSIFSFTDAGLPARIRQIDAGLEAIAARSTRVDIIDWSAEVKRYQSSGNPQGPIVSDTVHPTTVGQRILASLYEQALNRCRRPIV